MSQAEKAGRFAALHQGGNPVVLYNIWDAGGARAMVRAGAPAVATGSWSMAAAPSSAPLRSDKSEARLVEWRS